MKLTIGLVHNQEENCHCNHIPQNVKGIAYFFLCVTYKQSGLGTWGVSIAITEMNSRFFVSALQIFRLFFWKQKQNFVCDSVYFYMRTYTIWTFIYIYVFIHLFVAARNAGIFPFPCRKPQAEKYFRNLIKSTWNQSENGIYNLISVWFNNISKRFLYVYNQNLV